MNYIDLNSKKDFLIITFKFDPLLLAGIRSVPGRQYDKNKKQWLVPAVNALETAEILFPLGFLASEGVKNLLKVKNAASNELEAIKGGKIIDSLNFSRYPLFGFQKKGASFLHIADGALLADQPGLGKTLQTISALQDEVSILVFCPASLKYSWAEEIKKWTDEKVAVIDGKKEERNNQWQGKSKWTIANYELLLRDAEEIKKRQWDAIVCDEATRISNPRAKSVKILKTIPARKKIALTGTPISNTPVDIYSLIDWISPNYLGTFYQFKQKYCLIEPRFNCVVGYRHLDNLSRLISRFILRRTKEEVFDDFPKKTINDIIFDMSDKEEEFYKEIKSSLIKELLGIKFSPQTIRLAPVKMLRLKQCTGHPALLKESEIESSKLQVLRELLRPIIQSGEKAIVFTQFAEMAKILYDEFKEYNPRRIIGEIPAWQRQEYVQQFTQEENCKLMIMTEAGAYGLNLQVASYVIHYDFPWSVAKLTQREDRAHRIGQKKPVTVYNLIVRNSIDEYCVKVLYKKQKVSVELLNDRERLERIGLNEEDIKAILRV